MVRTVVVTGAKEAQLQQAFEGGCKYFEDKFCAVPGQTKGEVYVHRTNATDTETSRKIFEFCKDTILKQSLMESGFYA